MPGIMSGVLNFRRSIYQKIWEKADEKGESIFESREDAERGFYFVEDDKVKSAVVEYARRSFPDFHPEWGKAGWIRYIWPW
jgi:hypothetical protein